MEHKTGKRKAVKFFEDNYIMIHSLQSTDEQGCTDKCLELLKKSCDDVIHKPIPIIDEDGYHEQYETYQEVYRCSKCNARIYMTNYCSNCGAKIR